MPGVGNWDSDKALLAGPIPWMLIANYALVAYNACSGLIR